MVVCGDCDGCVSVSESLVLEKLDLLDLVGTGTETSQHEIETATHGMETVDTPPSKRQCRHSDTLNISADLL